MKGELSSILGIGGILIAALILFGMYIVYHRRKNRRQLMSRIRQDWGSWPAREYSYEELAAIAGYWENRKQDRFQIDSITWNDLDMDRIFMLANHTGSYIGEGYLYDLLHTPSFSREDLARRETLTAYFAEHESEREQVQYLFWKTGKPGRQPVFDAVYNLADVNPGSNLHHFMMGGLFLASIASLFVKPTVGILLLIAAMFATMMDYYNKKRPIERYIMSCQFLLKTLDLADEFGKLQAPVLKEYQDRVREARGAFGKLRRNSFFLMTGARMDSDPLTAVIMYVNSCFHIDLIQFATVVRELKRHIREFEILVDQMGQVETAIAIGSFRACMKDWCLPELVSEGSAFLETEQLYHPLIENPVKNSISARRGVLLTGSNASGKSTFLKTVALNAILAQTLHTCLADSWKGSAFRVYSSMALRDDLESQESYYIVEIKSLKRILDQIGAKGQGDVLCFVDEVLRGTNTVERIAASSQVLRYMTGPGVMCFAATHDVELTHILEDFYDNYHFQEEVEDQDIRFDYRLYPGRAGSRNAIKLLQIMGYDEQVVDRAETAARHFLETGEWQKQEGGAG